MDARGHLSPDEVRIILLDAIERVGGQQSLARELGISQWRITEVVTGSRPLGERLARALGFERYSERLVSYRAIPGHPRLAAYVAGGSGDGRKSEKLRNDVGKSAVDRGQEAAG